MNVGGTITVKDATIHLVEAVHSGGFGQDKAGPKYSGPADRLRHRNRQGADALPRGRHRRVLRHVADRRSLPPDDRHAPHRRTFHDGSLGAALAAKLLKVKTVIPMHYGTFPALAGTPDELRDALKKAKNSAKVVEFKPGEPQTLK